MIRLISENKCTMYIPGLSMGEYDSYEAPAPHKKTPGSLERGDSRRGMDRSDSRGGLDFQGRMERSESRGGMKRSDSWRGMERSDSQGQLGRQGSRSMLTRSNTKGQLARASSQSYLRNYSPQPVNPPMGNSLGRQSSQGQLRVAPRCPANGHSHRWVEEDTSRGMQMFSII